jgi:hypothetical protein
MSIVSDDQRRELLAEVENLHGLASASPEALPPSVMGKLQEVQTMLREPAPDVARLAMIGHGLMRWHLDQGFAEVEVHAAVSALALWLTELHER